MPNYGVVMGEAITVANLAGNKLVTGYGGIEDGLQSCAAVFLCNPATGACGLYHYPSGDISTRPTARLVLTQMRDAVQPTEAYIAYGIMTMNMGEDKPVPSDPFNMGLRDFVLHLLPMESRLRRMPAPTRIACIALNNGRFTITGQEPAGVVDLRNTAAGATAYGVIYKDGL